MSILVLRTILLKLIQIEDASWYVRLEPGEIQSQGYASLTLLTNVPQIHGLITVPTYAQECVHPHRVIMETT